MIIVYSYDNTGKQTGLTVEPVTVTSETTLEQVTGDDVTHFVYDPTASIPAVVYEQGPGMLNRVQHDRPDSLSIRFVTSRLRVIW